MPMSSNLKSGLKIVLALVEDYRRFILPSVEENSISVSLVICPREELLLGMPESIWVVLSTQHRRVSPLNLKKTSWPKIKNYSSKDFLNSFSRSEEETYALMMFLAMRMTFIEMSLYSVSGEVKVVRPTLS